MDIEIKSAQSVLVKSESNASVVYEVNPEEGTCQCKGYEHRGGCKHLKAVAAELRARGMDPKPKSREDNKADAEAILKEIPTLYTVRYAAQEVLSSGRVTPVQTSLGKPKFPLRYDIPIGVGLITPDWSMLRMGIERYLPAYYNKLNSVGVLKIARVFKSIGKANGNKPLALLCFEDVEKPGQWCHRRQFASWWEDKTGQKVYELTDEGELLDHHQIQPQGLEQPGQDSLL